MLDKALDQLVEKILSLDESSLTDLLPKYKKLMDNFEPTREWEKAVIIFFLINSVRVKNTLFNENVLQKQNGKPVKKKTNPFKLIKS